MYLVGLALAGDAVHAELGAPLVAVLDAVEPVGVEPDEEVQRRPSNPQIAM